MSDGLQPDDSFSTIGRCRIPEIESCIANGSIDVNARLARDPQSPLLHAAVKRRFSQVRVVELLLNGGARIDDTDALGQTACHVAAWNSNLKVLQLLIARGAAFDLEDCAKQTPLLIAMKHRYDESITTLLIEAGASLECVKDQLCVFAASGIAAIQTLLDRGVAVNQLRDSEMRTPLHLIAHLRSAETAAMVRLLVDVCGVDLQARTLDDMTCLTCTHIAAISSDSGALRCFIEAGADVNCVDGVGQTPLHRVLGYQCTVLLLAAGADMNILDNNGNTPCQLAASSRPRAMNVLPPLIAAGVDLRVLPNGTGVTITDEEVETARHDIATARLNLMLPRAIEVCFALQSRGLPALLTCEILVHACGPVAPMVAFHHWWKIVTIVKHFKVREE